MLRYIVPLLVFLVVAVFLGVGLDLNPREVPSPLIDKPAPVFNLPKLHALETSFSSKEMLGKVWLLNVWASWCVACRSEHPLLVQLSRANFVPIYGLNYKDEPNEAKSWLQQLGDPYVASLSDYEGKVGIDYGVYGVPETFVIDKQGVIRHKVIGPVTPAALDNCVLPLVEKLQQASAQAVVKRTEVEGCA
ncbi:MAG TPA: DsbE family thiol:disulfide interchange protein [Gammaproteobacteria bacterium]|nr:DsbE family thiol:disulfide interchange protein [Gammaproteobacteria bacterium]